MIVEFRDKDSDVIVVLSNIEEFVRVNDKTIVGGNDKRLIVDYQVKFIDNKRKEVVVANVFDVTVRT